MPGVEKRTVSLSSDQAAFIDSKIRSGDYATASEVVRAGLRALRERDEAVACWLSNEVAASYDAIKANPDPAISVDEALEAIRIHQTGRG